MAVIPWSITTILYHVHGVHNRQTVVFTVYTAFDLWYNCVLFHLMELGNLVCIITSNETGSNIQVITPDFFLCPSSF